MHCVMQYFTGLKYLKKSTAHGRTKARRRRKNFFDPYVDCYLLWGARAKFPYFTQHTPTAHLPKSTTQFVSENTQF